MIEGRRSRLHPDTLSALLEAYVSGIPAKQAAAVCDVNPNTGEFHYDKFRARLLMRSNYEVETKSFELLGRKKAIPDYRTKEPEGLLSIIPARGPSIFGFQLVSRTEAIKRRFDRQLLVDILPGEASAQLDYNGLKIQNLSNQPKPMSSADLQALKAVVRERLKIYRGIPQAKLRTYLVEALFFARDAQSTCYQRILKVLMQEYKDEKISDYLLRYES